VSAELEPMSVPIDGFDMQLRPSELRAVGAGMGGNLDLSDASSLMRLADALRALPPRDRAPLWELAVRHFARQKPLEQAAGEIGMDALHARTLLDAFSLTLMK
jgi:hypothetical protein